MLTCNDCIHSIICDRDIRDTGCTCSAFLEDRPHGEWVEVKRYNRKGKRFLDCSVCHYGEKGEIVCEVTKIPNFCPNCGADMREESERILDEAVDGEGKDGNVKEGEGDDGNGRLSGTS